MNLTNLGKGAWLDLSASWRGKGGDRLELWLPRNWPAEDSELRWRRIAADGAVRQGVQRGLEGLAPAEEIVVWTPAAETVFLRARLPTRSAAKIVQALPFALEEQLIDPPERLHFAFAHEADGALAVAVTRRERMESWLAALAAAGLAPTHLAPVTLSVPLAERAWTLAFVDGEIVLRSGARAGLGGSAERRPPAWLHAALAEARTEASAPERILLVDAPADLDSAAWREALGLPLESMPGDATVPPAPLDLLQQIERRRRNGRVSGHRLERKAQGLAPRRRIQIGRSVDQQNALGGASLGPRFGERRVQPGRWPPLGRAAQSRACAAAQHDLPVDERERPGALGERHGQSHRREMRRGEPGGRERRKPALHALAPRHRHRERTVRLVRESEMQPFGGIDQLLLEREGQRLNDFRGGTRRQARAQEHGFRSRGPHDDFLGRRESLEPALDALPDGPARCDAAPAQLRIFGRPVPRQPQLEALAALAAPRGGEAEPSALTEIRQVHPVRSRVAACARSRSCSCWASVEEALRCGARGARSRCRA